MKSMFSKILYFLRFLTRLIRCILVNYHDRKEENTDSDNQSEDSLSEKEDKIHDS